LNHDARKHEFKIYYSKSALHVSGDVFAHHQEHVTVNTRLTICIVQFQRIRDTSRQQLRLTLTDAINTVKWLVMMGENNARNV